MKTMYYTLLFRFSLNHTDEHILNVKTLLAVFLLGILFICPCFLNAQTSIQVNGNYTPEELIEDVLLADGCFTVVSGSINPIGNQQGMGYFSNGNSSVGMNDGVILASGHITNALGPNNSGGETGTFSPSVSDLDLLDLVNQTSTFPVDVFDAVGLEFDFEPTSDTIQFNYVFASEEYCEYVNSSFNDVFGFFINGPGISGGFTANAENIALVPNSTNFVAINSVNGLSNSNYYVHNSNFNCGFGTPPPPALNAIEYDGFTTVLTALAVVQPCETYHIKMVVADAGDDILDSAVFLEANSFTAGGSATVSAFIPGADATNNFALEGCIDGIFLFERSNDSDLSMPLEIPIFLDASTTATEGVDFSILPTNVVIPVGQTSVELNIEVFPDNLVDPDETIILDLENPCICTQTMPATITILEPLPITLTMPDGNACPGETSVLQPIVQGGIAPYFYEWDIGAVSDTIAVMPTEITAYTVTVTGFCGNTAMASATINPLETPTASISGDFVLCSANAETVALTVDFTGVGPFSFGYTQNGLEVGNFENVFENPFFLEVNEAGFYTLYNLNNNICEGITDGIANVVINDLEVNSTVVEMSCAGANDASISLEATGGTPPYSYDWTGDVDDTTSTITDLGEGSYTVLVSDVDNCLFLLEFDIEAPLALEGVISGNNITCADANDGTISVSTTGGTPPYVYTWNDPILGNENVLSNLPAGMYGVTISDASACTFPLNIALTQPDSLLIVNAIIADAACDPNNGSINISVLGGTPPLTYNWSSSLLSETGGDNLSSDTYAVTISDQKNCLVTGSYFLDFIPEPTLDLGQNVTLCDGESIILSPIVPSNATFNWQNGLSDESSFEVSEAGTYNLVIDVNGCTASDEITIDFDSIPIFDFGEDVTLCEGEIQTLTINTITGATYEWQDGSTNADLTVTESGTYWAIATWNNCTYIDSITFHFISLPTFDLGQDTLLCNTNNFEIIAPIADTYQWQDGSTGNAYLVNEAGIYELTISIDGCFYTDSLEVFYDPLPEFELGDPQILCEGESTILTANTLAGATYEWQDGSTNANLTVTESGMYSVTATLNNCTFSDSVSIDFTPLPLLNLGADEVLCEGQTVIFSAPEADSYEWQDGSTNSDFTVLETGTYTCCITTQNCTACDSVKVLFNTAPVFDLGENQSLCEGELTTLIVEVPEGTTFVWQDDTPNLTNYLVAEAGTYIVNATWNNCTYTDSVTIDYTPLPIFDLGNDTTLCNTNNFEITAPIADTYQWQDGSTGNTYLVNEAGVYELTIGIDGCFYTDSLEVFYDPLPEFELGETQTLCEGENTILTVNTLAGATYEWQDGSTNADFTVTESGMYSVTVSLNGCTFNDSVMVNYNSLPVFSLGNDTTLCEGDILLLNAPTADSYEWQDGSNTPELLISQAGTYWLTIGVADCYFTDSLVVDYNPIPIFNLGNDTTLCEGDILLLQAPEQDNYTYTWQDNSSLSSFELTTAGTYTLEIMADNCVYTDEIIVDYNSLPVFDLGESISLCEGESVTLSLPFEADNYEWQDGSTNSDFTVTESGTYTVTLTQNNCLYTDSLAVIYRPLPTVSLLEDTTICLGDTLSLNSIATAGVTYLWEDGSTAANRLISEAGIYEVSVNLEECFASDAISVEVETCYQPCEFAISNAFSPNGDGLNDYFKPITDCEVVTFSVYNRWGELVFKGTSSEEGWDGTQNGEHVEMGVYVWFVEFNFLRIDEIIEGKFQKGNVTLIR